MSAVAADQKRIPFPDWPNGWRSTARDSAYTALSRSSAEMPTDISTNGGLVFRMRGGRAISSRVHR